MIQAGSIHLLCYPSFPPPIYMRKENDFSPLQGGEITEKGKKVTETWR